jgi:hypothetical protein
MTVDEKRKALEEFCAMHKDCEDCLLNDAMERCGTPYLLGDYTVTHLYNIAFPKSEEAPKIKESGSRREFESGAVRDVAEGKGRCDLLPLALIGHLLQDNIFWHLEDYVRRGDADSLRMITESFIENWTTDKETAILEVSKHYEEGAKKYAERNWEIGIPLHCYIDSAVRHYLKYRRGDKDEPHDKAFLWNVLGAWWTHINKPELIDLPFAHKEENQCK